MLDLNLGKKKKTKKTNKKGVGVEERRQVAKSKTSAAFWHQKRRHNRQPYRPLNLGFRR